MIHFDSCSTLGISWKVKLNIWNILEYLDLHLDPPPCPSFRSIWGNFPRAVSSHWPGKAMRRWSRCLISSRNDVRFPAICWFSSSWCKRLPGKSLKLNGLFSSHRFLWPDGAPLARIFKDGFWCCQLPQKRRLSTIIIDFPCIFHMLYSSKLIYWKCIFTSMSTFYM